MISLPPKDPSEVLDYYIDWSVKLAGDTITTSTWEVPAGITKDSDTFTSNATSIWLSGGTNGTPYVLTNEIETSAGRTIRQSARIFIKPM